MGGGGAAEVVQAVVVVVAIDGAQVSIVVVLLTGTGTNTVCLPPTLAALYITLDPGLTGTFPPVDASEGATIRILCILPLGPPTNWTFCCRRDLIPAVEFLEAATGVGVGSGSVFITTPGGRGYFFSSFLRFAAFCSGVSTVLSADRF